MRTTIIVLGMATTFHLSTMAALANSPGELELGVIEKSVAKGGAEGRRRVVRVMSEEPLSRDRIGAVLRRIGAVESGPEKLSLFREVASRLDPAISSHWETASLAWAHAFVRLNGEAAPTIAARHSRDPSLADMDRALYLMVFRSAIGADYGHPLRTLAIETYRPYLHSSSPVLQEAAVLVARALWDYEMLEEIRDLAFTSGPGVRNRAFNLAQKMAAAGPGRGYGEIRQSEWADPYNPQIASELRERYLEFRCGIPGDEECPPDMRSGATR